MNEITLWLSAAERAELDDLADAVGQTSEEWAADAVRAALRADRRLVGREAERLARRHAPLLKRLGE
ncbi:hypothetical protein [Streptomyces sp. NPDC002054]|uniref:hypothetical protein n=1 Tax=Streptomyces sp. NPDC002054 TaxID=3154663 RepID=UPI003328A534